MRETTILVADDDPLMLKLLKANLEANKYRTEIAIDGAEAIKKIEREPPDLVLLDIMMPLMDGFEVCRHIREWSVVPIIMVTARGDERDKVKCLDMGADDYISKPFGVDELMARIRAVLRRSQASTHIVNESSFTCDGLTVNYAARTVKVNHAEIRLTPTEYNLLKELTLNAGKVLTYTHLLNRVWG